MSNASHRDVLVLNGDPLTDISLLQNKGRVMVLIKVTQILKNLSRRS